MSIEKIKAYRKLLQIKNQATDERFAKKSFGKNYIFVPSTSEILLSLGIPISTVNMNERNLPFKKPVRRKAHFSRSIHAKKEELKPKYQFKVHEQKPHRYSQEIELQNDRQNSTNFYNS